MQTRKNAVLEAISNNKVEIEYVRTSIMRADGTLIPLHGNSVLGCA
jgi:hypothetical protein